MKKYFLVICFTISLMGRLSAADLTLPEFKAQLSEHTASLGEAMVEGYNNDPSVAVRFVRSLETTDLYKTCTHPGFFTGKETQIRACNDLSRKLQNEMPKDQHAAYWTNEVNQRQDVFQAFKGTLSSKERQDVSENIRVSLVTQYNQYNKEASASAERFNQGHHNACWNLPMGESTECAFRRLLQMLKVDYPNMMAGYRTKMSQDVKAAKNTVDQYQE